MHKKLICLVFAWVVCEALQLFFLDLSPGYVPFSSTQKSSHYLYNPRFFIASLWKAKVISSVEHPTKSNLLSEIYFLPHLKKTKKNSCTLKSVRNLDGDEAQNWQPWKRLVRRIQYVSCQTCTTNVQYGSEVVIILIKQPRFDIAQLLNLTDSNKQRHISSRSTN